MKPEVKTFLRTNDVLVVMVCFNNIRIYTTNFVWFIFNLFHFYRAFDFLGNFFVVLRVYSFFVITYSQFLWGNSYFFLVIITLSYELPLKFVIKLVFKVTFFKVKHISWGLGGKKIITKNVTTGNMKRHVCLFCNFAILFGLVTLQLCLKSNFTTIKVTNLI